MWTSLRRGALRKPALRERLGVRMGNFEVRKVSRRRFRWLSWPGFWPQRVRRPRPPSGRYFGGAEDWLRMCRGAEVSATAGFGRN